MRQGFLGLAIGLAIGSALAAGAAFATGTPGHSVTSRAVAAAPAHVAAGTVSVPTTGSPEATGSVLPSTRPATHAPDSAHAPKLGSTHATHASAAHHSAGHHASTDGSVPALVHHREHAEGHDGGSCD